MIHSYRAQQKYGRVSEKVLLIFWMSVMPAETLGVKIMVR